MNATPEPSHHLPSDCSLIYFTEANQTKIFSKQKEIKQLCSWIRAKKQKVICIFESEGEELADDFLIQINTSFEKNSFNIIESNSIVSNKKNWYFQPLVNHLPKEGQITFFNNFWYGRALRNGKFLPKAFMNGQAKIWQNFPQFEKMLVNSGYKILKFWLQKEDEKAESKHFEKDYFDILLRLTNLTDSRWKIASKCSDSELTDYCFDLFLSEFQFQDLTFSDELVPLDLLKKRSFNLRWAMIENGVIPLTSTHSDFPIPIEIQQVVKDFNDGGVYPFPPANGLESFKNIASKVLTERKNIPSNPNLILPIDGESSGMFVTAKALIEEGDEAIIFNPMDYIFEKSITAAGGKVIRIPINLENNKLDFDAILNAITPKTKLIAFSNPLDPIGKLFSEEEMNILGKIAVKNNLWILNNESWSDTVFPPNQYTSIASISPQIAQRTVTIYGFEKSFGLAGMRIGFISAPSNLIFNRIKKAANLNSGVHGTSYLSQIAATAAFEKCWHWLDAFNEHLVKMRDFSVVRINKINGCKCLAPDGTFTLFVNIETFGMSSLEMAKYLLKEAKVAVIPGAKQWFGSQSEGYIRLSFATSKGILEEAFDRIEEALKKLRNVN